MNDRRQEQPSTSGREAGRSARGDAPTGRLIVRVLLCLAVLLAAVAPNVVAAKGRERDGRPDAMAASAAPDRGREADDGRGKDEGGKRGREGQGNRPAGSGGKADGNGSAKPAGKAGGTGGAKPAGAGNGIRTDASNAGAKGKGNDNPAGAGNGTPQGKPGGQPGGASEGNNGQGKGQGKPGGGPSAAKPAADKGSDKDGGKPSGGKNDGAGNGESKGKSEGTGNADNSSNGKPNGESDRASGGKADRSGKRGGTTDDPSGGPANAGKANESGDGRSKAGGNDRADGGSARTTSAKNPDPDPDPDQNARTPKPNHGPTGGQGGEKRNQEPVDRSAPVRDADKDATRNEVSPEPATDDDRAEAPRQESPATRTAAPDPTRGGVPERTREAVSDAPREGPVNPVVTTPTPTPTADPDRTARDGDGEGPPANPAEAEPTRGADKKDRGLGTDRRPGTRNAGADRAETTRAEAEAPPPPKPRQAGFQARVTGKAQGTIDTQAAGAEVRAGAGSGQRVVGRSVAAAPTSSLAEPVADAQEPQGQQPEAMPDGGTPTEETDAVETVPSAATQEDSADPSDGGSERGSDGAGTTDGGGRNEPAVAERDDTGGERQSEDDAPESLVADMDEQARNAETDASPERQGLAETAAADGTRVEEQPDDDRLAETGGDLRDGAATIRVAADGDHEANAVSTDTLPEDGAREPTATPGGTTEDGQATQEPAARTAETRTAPMAAVEDESTDVPSDAGAASVPIDAGTPPTLPDPADPAEPAAPTVQIDASAAPTESPPLVAAEPDEAEATGAPTAAETPIPAGTSTAIPSPTEEGQAQATPTLAATIRPVTTAGAEETATPADGGDFPTASETPQPGEPGGTPTPTPTPTLASSSEVTETPAMTETPTVVEPTPTGTPGSGLDATPVGSPTAAASPEATATRLLEGTPAVEGAPEATETPTVVPTATAATPAAPDPVASGAGRFELVAVDEAQTVEPGGTATYRLRLGYEAKPDAGPGSAGIEATTDVGWEAVLVAEGETDEALTVELAAGDSREVSVRVTAPADAAAGVEAVVTVSIQPAAEGDEPVTARVTATVEAATRIEIATDHVGFGRVSPTGEIDPATRGISAAVDARGATYVARDAVRATITSSERWAAACLLASATDRGSGTADGRLFWRPSATETWIPWGEGPSGDACRPDMEPGTHVVAYDLMLRVEWADPPGDVGGTLAMEPITAV